MNNKYVTFAVMLPLLAIAFMIVRAELSINQGTQWQLQIQGYDPRDLLRGHYLRFQVAYNFKSEQESCAGTSDCCLCLNDVGETVPLVSKLDCKVAKTQCDSIIRSEFERSLNRYYIAEDYARKAEKILQEAQIQDNAFLSIAVSEKGKPVITDLLIGEKPINDLLKK